MFLPPDYPRLMSERVLALAARGLSDPEQLSLGEIEELCGSVLEHIAEHGLPARAGDDLLGS
jgi:hypothetical protein